MSWRGWRGAGLNLMLVAGALSAASFLPPDGALAGAIHLTNIVMGAFRSGYLGYYAFTGFAGRGLMTAGLNAVVRHAFTALGLHRVGQRPAKRRGALHRGKHHHDGKRQGHQAHSTISATRRPSSARSRGRDRR